jgi:carbonic anhydrase
MRRRELIAGGAGLVLAGSARGAAHGPAPKPQNVLSPDAALKRLMGGNARYVEGLTRRHDFAHERAALAGGQNPSAAILGCADSRVAPEFIFDTARGDLFVCRVAGNIASEEMIASLEYAVANLATPLILVLGHGACGAVAATLESVESGETLPGHLSSLARAIAPAVKAARGDHGSRLDAAIRENVVLTARALAGTGPILAPAARTGKIRIVGGVYHLADGHVELLG